MTPEQKQQLISEIEARQKQRRLNNFHYDAAVAARDVDELLSLVKSQEAGNEDSDETQAIRARAYNSPQFSADVYMYDVRRLLHLLPQLRDLTANSMSSACVEKVKALRSQWHDQYVNAGADTPAALVQKELLFAKCQAASDVVKELESVSIQQEAKQS